MTGKKPDYLKRRSDEILIKTELWFAPLLVTLPIIVSFFLIRDWFYRGFTLGNSAYNGELFLALIILIGNIIFDMPFIKTLVTQIRR